MMANAEMGTYTYIKDKSTQVLKIFSIPIRYAYKYQEIIFTSDLIDYQAKMIQIKYLITVYALEY